MGGYNRQPTQADTDVLGPRIGAHIIDSIIITVLIYGAILGGPLIGGLIGGDVGGIIAIVLALVGFLLFLFYWLVLEGYWDGQTVGKKVLGIKVVKEDGSECDYGASVIRNLLEMVDGLFSYIVGLALILSSDMNQRLGDRVAGTVVVEE